LPVESGDDEISREDVVTPIAIPCFAFYDPAVGPVKVSTEYLAQIETAISIIYGKYVYTYGYLR
jgi:hypothetical protein